MSNAGPRTRQSTQDMLNDPRLFRQQVYINGQWRNSLSSECIEIVNPSTCALIGTVPKLSVDEVKQAINLASKAYPEWRALLPQQRSVILKRWYELILENKDDLALLLTMEQGKPLSESQGEIDYGADFVNWFAEEAKRRYGETIPSHLSERQLVAIREPIGVAALVTPWNWPNAMLTRKAAAALAAGCTVVAYQSMETPFSALALAELADRAGFPPGVINILAGHSRAIVGELCTNPTIRVLSFTGSTRVGKILLKQCADTVKRTCMELGGHAPFIGFPDVEIGELVNAARSAKFQTSGQDCLAANRIYIHRDVYETFLKEFTDATLTLKVGDGLTPGVDIGPLQNEKQVKKVKEHVQDALSKGARLLAGGEQARLGDLFYQPTVLADVTPSMKINHEETFGPVAAVIPFDTEDEVIYLANDSDYGLAAYVYARDIGVCWRMSMALEYGMVGLNSVKITGPPIPFGGMKQSGMGKEGSWHGLNEFTELKYVCMGGIGT